MAENKKKPAKRTEKPPVLTGTVPEWANTQVIAQLLGKTVRRVQQLTQEGVLETEVPPGGGARKYRTCETVQRYISHIERKAKESGAEGSTADLNRRKLEAEVALKESQGELQRLKADIAQGKYIPTAQATEELAEFMARLKKYTLNIPARVAGQLSGYVDEVAIRAMEKSMRKEAEAMLVTFVEAATLEIQEDGRP